MKHSVSDQDIIEKIINKENELIAAQECRDLFELWSKLTNPLHIYVLEKAIDDYESKLMNDIQSLEDFVENSVYKNRTP